jgi:hypothetical protein
VVVFRRLVSHLDHVERRAQALLKEYRYRNTEWFAVSKGEAVDAVNTAAADSDGIESWRDHGAQELRVGDRVVLSLRSGQMFALIRYVTPMDLVAGKARVIDLWQAHATGDTVELHATASASDVASFSENDPRSTIDPVPFLDRAETAPNGVINGLEKLVPGDRLVWLAAPDARVPDRAVFEADDYCQVVSRAWKPQLSFEGLSLLLHDYRHGDVPSWMWRAVLEVLDMPPPRSWAYNVFSDIDCSGWRAPELWLRQLAPDRR